MTHYNGNNSRSKISPFTIYQFSSMAIFVFFLTIRLKNILILFYIFRNSFLQSTYLNTVLDCWQSKNKDLLPPTHKGKSLTTKDIAAWKQYFLSDLPNRDYTLTTAEISRGKNARAWVSMVLYLKK